MSNSNLLIMELKDKPGVLAAGEFAYRGDRFTCKGDLTEEQARMASIMCRATTMSVHMQCDILGSFSEECGLNPSSGWVIRGDSFTVCSYANVFVFMNTQQASLDEVVQLMRKRLGSRPDDKCI